MVRGVSPESMESKGRLQDVSDVVRVLRMLACLARLTLAAVSAAAPSSASGSEVAVAVPSLLAGGEYDPRGT